MPVNLTPAGTVWQTVVTAPVGGDPRVAASVELPAQQLMDRSEFLYRVLNGDQGYSNLSQGLITGAGFVLAGLESGLEADTNYIGNSGGTSTNTVRGDLDVTGGFSTVSLGVFGGGISVSSGNVAITSGNLTVTSGVSQINKRKERVEFVGDVDEAFGVNDVDHVHYLDGMTADRDLDLSHVDAELGMKIMVSTGSSGFFLNVNDGIGGPVLFALKNASTFVQWIEFTWGGSGWIATRQGKLP